ncbi:MAG: DUF4403 family protein [Bacteroidota bacterium]
MKLNPDKPASGTLGERPTKENSTVILPFSIEADALQGYLNEVIPRGQVASGGERVSNSLSYTYSVHRNSDIQVTTRGNEIIFNVPLQAYARGTKVICVGWWSRGRCRGGKTSEHADARPTINVELRLKIEIDENYQIKPEAKLRAELTGDTHLHIDLFGNAIRINIDIRDKLIGPIQEVVNKYQSQINQKIMEWVDQYDLHQEVDKYWQQGFKSIAMGDVWMNIEPEKVIFQNLNSANGKLKTGLGVVANLSISSEPKTIPSKPLPNVEIVDDVQGKFHISLPASATFKAINELARRDMVGRKYEFNKHWVKFRDIEISGLQLVNGASAILIDADIRGKLSLFKRVKGHIYLYAIPAFDLENKVVYVDQFALTPETNNIIVNMGVPFLLRNFYYNDVKKKLMYDYSEDWVKYEKLIKEKIEEVSIDQLTIRGSLEGLKFHGIYVGSDLIELLITADGRLETDPISLNNTGVNDIQIDKGK